MTKKKPFPANNLWAMANDVVDSGLTAEEARTKDLTPLFYHELEKHVKNKELININMNGLVRSGKSTAAIQLCWEIKRLILQHHKLDRPMSNNNILRDQNEYARAVKRRKEEFKHECDVIDEWSEMELAGFNATIEEKFLKQFSDVQAGRYYHRIACSPRDQTDQNADILLQVVPGSRTYGKTLCLLSYRLSRGDITQPVLLGYVVIDVTQTLAAEWYQTYLKKKEEKWELMNKHNVKSPRELEYAEIILNTYNRMLGLFKIGFTQKKHIKLVLREEADRRGVWFSILGDRDVLETLEGLAELTDGINKLGARLQKKPSEEIAQHYKELKKQLANILGRQEELSMLWITYQNLGE